MSTDAGDNSADSAEPSLSFREYAKYVDDVVWIGSIPWHVYGGILRPLSMPHVPIEVDRARLRQAISDQGAALACWTSHWDAFSESEWWWTCCDSDPYDVEEIDSSRGRRSIRQGLRRCSVRRVEPDVFGRLAHPIYRGALESYSDRPPTEEEYAQSIKRTAAYPGTDLWGAFYEEDMAAFATCQIVDGAVTLGSTKSDLELSKHNPNAALFYTIAQYYLGRGLRYVTNGHCTMIHPTRINEFLGRLGFRKVFCRLNVELSPLAGLVEKTRIARWGWVIGLRRVFPDRWAKLSGFDRLMRIAETFE